MYEILVRNQEAFEQLCDLSLDDFEILYSDVSYTIHQLNSENRNRKGRQVAPGAGRKFSTSKREQLLAVLLWANLQLHPQQISYLLGVHVSTFTRIRHRILAAFDRLNYEIEIPNRYEYRNIEQLIHDYPEIQVFDSKSLAR